MLCLCDCVQVSLCVCALGTNRAGNECENIWNLIDNGIRKLFGGIIFLYSIVNIVLRCCSPLTLLNIKDQR